MSATVDVESMRFRDEEDRDWAFELPEHRWSALLEGRDRIAETLRAEEEIDAFEATRPPPSWVSRSGTRGTRRFPAGRDAEEE